jgi:hypothetical protein
MNIIDISALELTYGWNITQQINVLGHTMDNGWCINTGDSEDDPYTAAARIINKAVGIGEVEMLACNFSVAHERNARKAITAVLTAVVVRLRHDGFISLKSKAKSPDPMKAFVAAYGHAMADICRVQYPDKTIILADDQLR